MIVLSRKSWHYSFNTWCWGEKPTTKSLCPYFWATLLGLILSPAILLLKGILYLIEMWSFSTAADKVDDFMDRPVVRKVDDFMDRPVVRKVSNVIGWIILIFMVGLLATMLGFALYTLFSTHTIGGAFAIIGIILGVFAVGIGIILGVCYFFTSDTWDMIRGMAYGLKNKVCPMLTFKD